MAEVFGVVAGVLGALDVGTRGIGRLAELKATLTNVPPQLYALQNEAEDLRMVLDEMKNAGDAIEAAGQHDHKLASALQSRVDLAREKLGAMDDKLVQTLKLKKYKQKIRWLRINKEVEMLKDQIQGVRRDLQSLLQAHQLVKTSRLELDITSIKVSLAEVAQQQQLLAPGLNQFAEETTQTRIAMQHFMTAFQNQTQQAISALTTINSTMQQRASGVKSAPLQVTNTVDDQPAISENLRSPYSSKVVTFRTHRRYRCPTDCECRCHEQSTSFSVWRVPYGLAWLVGSLFIRYTGSPVGLSKGCSSAACRARQSLRLEASYTFPAWFAAYSVLIAAQTTAARGPELVIGLRNRVDWRDSPLFDAVNNADDRRVARICRDTPWHMRDVRIENGYSPLHRAIYNSEFGLVKTLIAAGADPNATADDGYSPQSSLAFRAIGGQSIPEDIMVLLKVNEYLEEVDMPPLALSVLGVPRSTNLTTLVERQRNRAAAELAIFDSFGFTPLLWACRIGNARNVRLLLELGADPNTPTAINKSTPLHLAACCKSPEGARCIAMLLEGGANICNNLYGKTPVHIAARYGSAETVRLLLEAGGSATEMGDDGWVPLCTAASNENIDTLRQLLNAGVSPSSTNQDSWSALALAINMNDHACVEVLLARGADYCYVQKEKRSLGRTILHDVAFWADERMFGILARHGLAGVNIEAIGSEGNKAKDMIEWRRDKDDELVSAFEELLQAVQRANTPAISCDPRHSSGVKFSFGEHIGSDGYDGSSDNDGREEQEVFYDAEDTPGY